MSCPFRVLFLPVSFGGGDLISTVDVVGVVVVVVAVV